MDAELQKINKYITLPKSDRCQFSKYFERIRYKIISTMKSKSEVFNQIANGSILAGSTADNLKIGKPNEFDLILQMKLPHKDLISVKCDPKIPGNVTINLSDMLKKLETEKQNRLLYLQLKKLCTEDNYLLQDKWHSWMESIMVQTIGELGLTFTIDNYTFVTKFKKCGPALTFAVNVNDNFFSIDFVPSLVFDKTKWIAKRPYPNNSYSVTNWLAVPKPIKNGKGSNISWQGSYTATEDNFINNKYNLKNTLRMIKKIRDKNNIENLKSYFIKTVYLWETTKTSENFWNQSVETVLMHMLERVVECLQKGEIKFFWHDNFNMLSKFSNQQIYTMYGQLKKPYEELKKNRQNPLKIAQIFLTPEELVDYYNPLIQPEEDPVEIVRENIENTRSCILM